jgi:hypothetical protein
LEPPELRWSCQAHANLPPLGPLRRTPNQGPFPLHQFCCLVNPNGTVDPSDTQRCFRLNAELRAATPRSTGSPALRRALCRRATPTTPVSDPAVIGRLLLRDPAAFPVRMAGRRSQRPFRGLLGLHSYCGPSTRRPTHGGPMFRELQRFGCPPRRLGSYRDVPTISRTGLSPARDTALSAAHTRTRVSALRVVTRTVATRAYGAVATCGCHGVIKFEWFVTQAVQTHFPSGLKGTYNHAFFQELDVFE